MTFSHKIRFDGCACVVQLSLALEHAARRKEALFALRDLLNTAAVDSAFLQQALPCLTAQEVVHLLNWAEAASTPIKSPWYGSTGNTC